MAQGAIRGTIASRREQNVLQLIRFDGDATLLLADDAGNFEATGLDDGRYRVHDLFDGTVYGFEVGPGETRELRVREATEIGVEATLDDDAAAERAAFIQLVSRPDQTGLVVIKEATATGGEPIRLESLPQRGPYALTVSLAAATQSVTLIGLCFAVGGAESQVLRLPSRRLFGSVVADDTGMPLEGVVVTAFSTGERSLVGNFAPALSHSAALTAHDGTAILANLFSGPHVVRAYKPGYAISMVEIAGADDSFQLTLRRSESASIRGTVRDRRGRPRRATLVLQTTDGFPTGVATESDDTGSFEIDDVPVGAYELKAEGARSVFAHEDVTVSSAGADVEITLAE